MGCYWFSKFSNKEVGKYAMDNTKSFISNKLNYISRHATLTFTATGIFISVFSLLKNVGSQDL